MLDALKDVTILRHFQSEFAKCMTSLFCPVLSNTFIFFVLVRPLFDALKPVKNGVKTILKNNVVLKNTVEDSAYIYMHDNFRVFLNENAKSKIAPFFFTVLFELTLLFGCLV